MFNSNFSRPEDVLSSCLNADPLTGIIAETRYTDVNQFQSSDQVNLIGRAAYSSCQEHNYTTIINHLAGKRFQLN
jgi:hypothetical protein